MVKPYLSIVVTSRNDNHGGDLNKRMRIFMRSLIYQCNKFKVNAELVVVEWNPPKDRKLLHKIMPSTNEKDFLSIRYIIVPPDIHSTFKHSDVLPIYQMIAKNVGIRRSQGEFILCTNIDLIFSDELMIYLSEKKLRQGNFYRANRCDIPSTIDESLNEEEILSFAKNNVLNRLGKLRKVLWRDRFIWVKWLLQVMNKISAIFPFLNLNPDLDKDYIIHHLDCDACGDFTMMSKYDWLKIKGYVELEMYSLHIDSMALFAAVASGMKQIVFKPEACTYHISHGGGWNIMDPEDKLRFYSKFPCLEWWAVYDAGRSIMKENSNYKINKNNWGLLEEHLEEI